MRMSDGSSDVCSSDLGAESTRFRCRSDGGLEDLLKALARQALGYPLYPPLTEQRMLGEQLCARVLEQLFQALCAPEAEEMSQPLPQIGFSRRAHHEFGRSEENTSELQSLMRTSYAVFCLKIKQYNNCP